MKTIEVTEKEVKAAFDVAKSEEMKQVLAALFCKEEKNKPNLDDYKTIKSYEDACEALDISPVLNCPNLFVCEKHPENREMQTHYSERMELPSHIIALMKLETISRALCGKSFQPQPDAEGNKIYYYPWFALFTKEEIESMDEDDKGALLSADAHSGAFAGFGYLTTTSRSSYAAAYLGFRFCQETEEKAKYFGKQFASIWAEYLAFNFTVGDKIIK